MLQPVGGAQGAAPNQISNTTFLQMLVGELQNQDPFSQQDPTAFITQLAQMTTLQTMGAIDSDIQNLTQAVELSGAGSLIGKSVTLSVNGQAISGTVTAAGTDQSGNALLTVSGQQYPYTDIVGVD